MNLKNIYAAVTALCFAIGNSVAQQMDSTAWWHHTKRNVHYQPSGTDFILVNGKGRMRFNRALYGTHTAFRVEAGDLPEFALYMPGMGGNFKFGFISAGKSKWLTDAKDIKAMYRPGSMLYEVRDPMLGNGTMYITVLALAGAEGMIIKTAFKNISSKVDLAWMYGGASGKKFSRDGDIGADPESSFYLQPSYCLDNVYHITNHTFNLQYGSGKILSEEDRYGNKPAGNNANSPVVGEANTQKELTGIVPLSSTIRLIDATQQRSPSDVKESNGSATPAIAGSIAIANGALYFSIYNPASGKSKIAYEDLEEEFHTAENARSAIANRVVVHTPDPYINTLGGALAIAADAIWEEPSFMHGAVAWRMRLPAWRGPYVADPLGWHDRARRHFSSYALSQVTSPETGPVVADTALHLARQLEALGTSVFSSGYISRNPGGKIVPHHYDMNLVFVDELLNHFNWTGDIDFVKQLWPLLQRHLAWEKRNFDMDGDGLYDAYAAIWASDALQYSGGGVTHSSAYNYRANKLAAEIANLIGEDPLPYQQEADKVLQAMNTKLWMPSKGWYAEYKDLLGHQLVHPAAGLWTIYHAIDEQAADPFQAYQSTRYIDHHIPHIPVQANGLNKKGLYVLSTTNWQPYEWSLNNVAFAENQHMALAYWQAGRANEAYKLWQSSLIESMYLGASPGGFQQLSYYDAIRGELYRDFADGIGMTARSLVEGLFGINPNALRDTLTVKPGFPADWDHASLTIPDLKLDFKRKGNSETYTITTLFKKQMRLRLLVKAKSAGIKRILLNNKDIPWKNLADAVSDPVIEIQTGHQEKYIIQIVWQGNKIAEAVSKRSQVNGSRVLFNFPQAVIQKVLDPQKIFLNTQIKKNTVQANLHADTGRHIAFVQLKQDELVWWEPIEIRVKPAAEFVYSITQGKTVEYRIKNNTSLLQMGKVILNNGKKYFSQAVTIPASSISKMLSVPASMIVPGTNKFIYNWSDKDGEHSTSQNLINWNVSLRDEKTELIDLDKYFNDKVTRIFKNQYISPRPKVPTLQLPTQGIGEWTHPLTTANIDDNGLRRLAGEKNTITVPQGITFQTPSDTAARNIIFTSQWDNYPKEVAVPLSGTASHVYLLMAGSTNPMQSRLTNGAVIIWYTDNTSDTLLLKNPETWWPVEQDYYSDGYAFTTNAPRPIRIRLKTGKVLEDNETTIAKNKGKMIDGGAATVLDMPLNNNKSLKQLTLQTIANDVVMGIMSVTLVR